MIREGGAPWPSADGRVYYGAMELDRVIAELYDAVCFEPGGEPSWGKLASIFAPGARIVSVTDEGVTEFDLASYRKYLEGMIASGAMPSFWEGELWREARVFGEVANVLSAYDARRTRGGEVLHRGVISIQLFQRDGQWWISSMLWRREGSTVRITDRP